MVGATALGRRCLRRPSRALPAPEVQAWAAGWPGGQGKRSVTFDCGKHVRNAVQSACEVHQGNCKVVSGCNKEQGSLEIHYARVL